jgi:hypothetical protein
MAIERLFRARIFHHARCTAGPPSDLITEPFGGSSHTKTRAPKSANSTPEKAAATEPPHSKTTTSDKPELVSACCDPDTCISSVKALANTMLSKVFPFKTLRSQMRRRFFPNSRHSFGGSFQFQAYWVFA